MFKPIKLRLWELLQEEEDYWEALIADHESREGLIPEEQVLSDAY